MLPSSPTIATLLARRARELPDALAFTFGSESLTFRQLADDAERLGGILRHDGIEAGDRVALVLPAGLDLVRLFYAIQRIGAAPCIFDPHVPAPTTEHRVAGIRPRCMLTDVPGAGRSAVPLPPLAGDPNAVAFLQQTSGTSGEPLAAVILQRHVLASLDAIQDRIDPSAGDVLAGWVPPWHDLGLLRFVIDPVAFGLPCHLVRPAVKTIPEWFAVMSRVRATITGAPDFAWQLASRLVDPATVDLRALRWATNGGEPVRASTIEAFESRFGLQDVICPGYGLAEATLGVSTTRGGDGLRVDDRGNVSCGKPLKGVEVRIDEGEILVRGPAVFDGYFDAEEATGRALRQGWLHTGDTGALDDDGHLYVLGRRRAMIKRGGMTLAPRELEEAAQTVAGVRLAAAVGVPATLTEEIVVVVEVEREAEPGAGDVERAVATAVEQAIGFPPDRVLVQGPRTIARTSNGKIRHAVLRDQLSASRLRSSPSVISEGRSSK
jgi:acyl-CoA synthetase (AMP-forming)/AMP-acid ligase II